jgi:hypothetical protein
MALAPGNHTFGPEDAQLLVHTLRTGAAAKAGHDLVIEVTSWSGTLEVAEDARPVSLALSADGESFRVREGTGGIQALGEDDKAGIKDTIDEEVLKRSAIEFRSTAIEPEPDGERLHVDGELELLGNVRPLQFELRIAPDGTLSGAAKVKQSDWGIKPYSALFGTLKVADEVTVTFEATSS